MIARLRRPAHSKPTLPYRVVQQTSPSSDAEMCRHRFDWTAELCAQRRERREDEIGVFYTALPAATDA